MHWLKCIHFIFFLLVIVKQCFGRKIRQYLDRPTCQTTQRSESKEIQLKLHARIQKVLSEGVQLRQRFLLFSLVGERREDPGNTISGPTSARQQNATKWRFASVLMMAEH